MWYGWKIKILFCIAALFIALLAFMIGAAYGASVNNQEFLETFIPIFSALGSWVSGIGAVGAVCVALWLAEEQALNDRENLDLSFSVVMTSIHESLLLCVEATSTGKKPSSIMSISITGGRRKLVFTELSQGSSPIPIKIDYGEKATWFLRPNTEKQIGDFIKNYCDGDPEKIQINIHTTTKTFSLKPNDEIRGMLKSHAKQ